MVQLMAWPRSGDKALSEPMLFQLCGTVCVCVWERGWGWGKGVGGGVGGGG